MRQELLNIHTDSTVQHSELDGGCTLVWPSCLDQMESDSIEQSLDIHREECITDKPVTSQSPHPLNPYVTGLSRKTQRLKRTENVGREACA